MRKFLVAASLVLFQSNALAGQVIQLTVGQTQALQNGDVVACMGGTPTPAEDVNCTLMVSGLPPFRGSGRDKDQAQRFAMRECELYAQGQVFKDSFGRQFNPCLRSPSNPFWMGYQCK